MCVSGGEVKYLDKIWSSKLYRCGLQPLDQMSSFRDNIDREGRRLWKCPGAFQAIGTKAAKNTEKTQLILVGRTGAHGSQNKLVFYAKGGSAPLNAPVKPSATGGK